LGGPLEKTRLGLILAGSLNLICGKETAGRLRRSLRLSRLLLRLSARRLNILIAE
jgi:hypothetical protein